MFFLSITIDIGSAIKCHANC